MRERVMRGGSLLQACAGRAGGREFSQRPLHTGPALATASIFHPQTLHSAQLYNNIHDNLEEETDQERPGRYMHAQKTREQNH
jgi:hypothetical protein